MVFLAVILGAVIGALYQLWSRGRAPDVMVTVLLGIAGSLVGGFLARAIIVVITTQAYVGFSVLGALVLLAVFHLAAGRDGPVR